MSARREKKARQEAEAQGLSKKQIARKKEERRNKTIKYTSAIVAILIVAALVSLAITASGLIERNTTALTIGNREVSLVELNYYYTESYANYVQQYANMGMTQYLPFDPNIALKEQEYEPADEENNTPAKSWSDYFVEQATTNIQRIIAYSGEANAAGMSLNSTNTDAIDTQLTNIKAAAKSNNMSAGRYLSNVYGRGMNEAELKKILERELLGVQFQQDKYNSFVYDDAKLTEEYDQNKDNYDLVDYRSFYFDGTIPEPEPDENGETPEITDAEREAALTKAREDANDMNRRIISESSFVRLAEEYAPEDKKETYQNESATLFNGLAKKDAVAALAPWLFGADTIPGESTVIDVDGGSYVVFLVKRYRQDYESVNVRHILTQFKNGASATPTEAEDAEALEKAESIEAEWINGGKTEELFADLAEKYTTDTGSASNGGLYENVAKGTMEPAFDAWCFDPERKPGDSGIVKTAYGYHNMYFSGSGEVYWKVQARETLAAADAEAYYDSLIDGEYKLTGIGVNLKIRDLP